MKRSWLYQTIALMVALLIMAAGTAEAQFKDLVRRIPSTANSVILINVDQVMDSPLAQREGWRSDYEKAYASGLAIVPPNSTQFAVASELDYDLMNPNWGISVMNLSIDPSMPLIARDQGGVVEEIGSLPAVELRNDTFIVQFEKRTIGVMTPAHRQNVVRWVQQSAAKTVPTLSPYLMEAVGYLDELGTPIVMAMDLEGVLALKEIELKLNDSAVFKRQTANASEVAEVLSTIQGVTLGIAIEDAIAGKIRVDFGVDAKPLTGFSKALLLEILQKRGAYIEELARWKSTVDGMSIAIEGELTESGLHRIMSLVDAPLANIRDPKKASSGSAEPTEEDAAKLTLDATKTYFDGIQRKLKDLDSRESVSVGQIGLFYDRYASQIDQMPYLHVDPKMIDYGQAVVNALRNASASIKGIGIKTNAETASIYQQGPSFYGGQTRFGYYGYSYGTGMSLDVTNVGAERRAVTQQNRAEGFSSALSIFRGIDDMTSQVRREMTEKYQVQF